MSEGVDGGERGIRLNRDGNPDQGGQPQRSETQATVLGTEWRNKYRDEIRRQRLIRPQSNWY